MKKLIVLIVLCLATVCHAGPELKLTFGDEVNAHVGFRPFPSQHFSVGFAGTGVRESPTNVRQLGVDDWSIGGYLEMAVLDFSSIWPQLPAMGEGHAGVELMYDLKERENDDELQLVPYVGVCVGIPQMPNVFIVTDTRWYDRREELVVTVGPLIIFE